MSDDSDPTASTLGILVSEALKQWNTDALFMLLQDDNEIVRVSASRELQLRGDRSIFEKTLALFHDNNSKVREMVAYIMGQLGTPLMPYREESLHPLLSLTYDNDANVRSASAAAFGHLCYNGTPQEVEDRLVQLCSDKDKDVRACAAYALGNSSGSEEIRALLIGLQPDEYVGPYAELALEILDDKPK